MILEKNPIHPGEILNEEYLKVLGISAGALAKRLFVPRTRIERIIGQKTSITTDTALRLARFNVGNNRAASEGLEKRFFRGVPSPAGAMLALMPMYFAFLFPDAPMLPAWLLAVYLMGIGGLMISQVPTWSFKSVTLKPENTLYFLIGFVAILGGLLTSPWATLFGLGLCYGASVIAAGRLLRRPQIKPEERLP